MGGKSSKQLRSSRCSSFASNSNSFNHHPPHVPLNNDCGSRIPTYDGPLPESNRRPERNFSRIGDNYNSVDQVSDALARAGLESSNLIVGIDCTKSNEWTGDVKNPYEQAISIIGRTLSRFDEDNLIPCFGFGDEILDFSFYPDGIFCQGFEEALMRYRELVPQLRLAGPTSFAPVTEMATPLLNKLVDSAMS